MRQLIEQLRSLLEEPKWRRPDVSRSGDSDKSGDAYGELRRTIGSLRIPAKDLHAAAKNAKLGALSDKHWSKISNSESWGTTTKAKAQHYATAYRRDIKKIYHGFKHGEEIPAPIVLHRKGKPPYVVAGNTRLMAARAAKIRPKVLHVRLKK
jgi:hypothetical protein